MILWIYDYFKEGNLKKIKFLQKLKTTISCNNKCQTFKYLRYCNDFKNMTFYQPSTGNLHKMYLHVSEEIFSRWKYIYSTERKLENNCTFKIKKSIPCYNKHHRKGTWK